MIVKISLSVVKILVSTSLVIVPSFGGLGAKDTHTHTYSEFFIAIMEFCGCVSFGVETSICIFTTKRDIFTTITATTNM